MILRHNKSRLYFLPSKAQKTDLGIKYEIHRTCGNGIPVRANDTHGIFGWVTSYKEIRVCFLVELLLYGIFSYVTEVFLFISHTKGLIFEYNLV